MCAWYMQKSEDGVRGSGTGIMMLVNEYVDAGIECGSSEGIADWHGEDLVSPWKEIFFLFIICSFKTLNGKS